MREAEVVLVDGGGVIGDQVDTGYLLEHLVDVGKDHTVEVSVLVHCEQVLELPLGHFKHSILDGGELVLDVRVIGRSLVESDQDLESLLFATLQDEPSGRFRKAQDGHEDDQREDDLEGDRETPCNLGVDEGEAKVEPVTKSDTCRNQRTFNHDQLPTSVRLGGLGLPCRDGGGVHPVADTGDETANDEVAERESRALQDGTNGHDDRTNEDGLATPQKIAEVDGGARASETSQIVRGDGNTWEARIVKSMTRLR